MKTIRIFISSPGDVAEERDKAEAVIRSLDRHYGGRVRLVVVRWENLGLGADASFQEGIVKVLNEDGGVDIGVFILWSRLGTPLGAWALRSDGRRYRSGTEQEFDLMLEASRRSDGSRPHLLAYVREDDRAYSMALAATPPQQRLHVVEQWTLAREFITETFTDAVTGQNLRAFHLYDQPVTFADRLRTHLRNVIDRLIGEVAGAVTWDERPYRGLESFDIAHEAIFRGREEHVCDVLQQLRRNSDNGCAFAVVVGASGSGKSSLVRAGVVPSLLHNANDGAKQWRHAAFTPSLVRGAPLAGLVEALASEGALPELRQQVRDLAHLSEKLARDPESARDMALLPGLSAARDSAGGPVRIIVIVDQMEELFVPGNVTEEERGMFLRAIRVLACYSLPGEGPPFRFVATLRSDFYAAAQRDEVFLKLKGEHGHYDLLAPDPAALQRIITEPARLAGVEFEEREGVPLDRRLLADAIRGADALPLLEYALDTLYENRDLTGGRARMTYEAYDAMGGVEGALGGEAERVFQSLPEEIRGVFGAVMQELVTVDASPEAPPLRQRVPLDLVGDSKAKKELVAALLKARFLTADRDARSGASVVGLAHEALLRRWDRLVLWIEANREHLRVRARVEQAQVLWERAHAEVGRRDSSLLLPEGLPLEEARGLLRTTLPRAGTAGYIRASIGHVEAVALRRRRIRRNVVAVLSVLTMLAVVASLWAWKKQCEARTAEREAQLQADLAEKRGLDIEQAAREQARLLHDASMADYAVAVQRIERDGKWHEGVAYLARALRWEPGNPLPAARLYSTLAMYGHEKQTWPRLSCGLSSGIVPTHAALIGGKISRDGKRVVGLWDDGAARVWDSVTGNLIGEPLRYERDKRARDAEFSPDGSRIAIFSEDQVRVWDASTGKALGEPLKQGNAFGVRFSPDGARILTFGGDYTARIWDVSTGRLLGEPLCHDHYVHSAEFSRDGARVITSSEDKTARIWDSFTGKPLGEPLRHEMGVKNAQFSPDGTRIVTADGALTERVWDAVSCRTIISFKIVENILDESSEMGHFSPDGTRFLSVRKSSAQVWDVFTGKLIGKPIKQVGLRSARFSPDGSRVVTASSSDHLNTLEEVARVWDASSGRPLSEALPLEGRTRVVQFSADCKRILALGHNGCLRTWDVVGGNVAGIPLRHKNKLTSGRFSSDGTRVVTASLDKTARIWDVATGQLVGVPLQHEERVVYAEFSPDGTRVVTTSWDKTARIWDVATGKPLGTALQHNGVVSIAKFSPDGMRVVTASWDKTARIWDAATGQNVGVPLQHEGRVGHAEFSPDGTRVVTASWDKTARIWDVATGKPLGAALQHNSVVSLAEFSPDGTRVVTASEDKTARIWDASTGKPVGDPLLHGERFSNAEILSAQFSCDSTRIVTSTRMGVVQVWDARTGSKIGDKVQHEGALHAQFSRDSDLVVTVSHEYGPFNSDRAVRFWNAATGKQESEPLRHDTGMISVEFSPDDSRLLSVSEDDTAWIQSAPVRLSSLPSPVPTWILRRSQAIAGLEFSEDGELVAMPNEARRSILLEETPGDDAWAKLARWLVMPSDKRTLTPNSPVTVRLIAERERDSGTRKGLESALRYNPTVPLAHVLLAGVLAEEDAKKNAEERDPSIPHRVGFLRYCGLRLLPEDAALQSRAAESLVKQGVYKGALSAVGKALALEPKNLAALRAQSSAFSGLKRNEEALAAYRAVLEAGGVDEGDFSAPAYLAAKMQRQSDAKFFLAAGRAKLPGSVPFARMEGWSLINLGDEAGAVAAFRRGESLVGAGEKPDEDLLAGLALSLWLNQQRDEAVAAYIRLIESREDRAWATPEKIAGTGWPEAERVPLESLRIETLRRHPEWNPKPTDAAK